MKRAAYPTDLTDRKRQVLETLVPLVKPGSGPAKYLRREVVNGIQFPR